MSPLRTFRYIAILEGISYLLFAVTMPLKYVYEIMEPNFYVGLVHGLLFLLYCAFGLSSAIRYKWTFGFSAMAFLASLIPFGTFTLKQSILSRKGSMLTTEFSNCTLMRICKMNQKHA